MPTERGDRQGAIHEHGNRRAGGRRSHSPSRAAARATAAVAQLVRRARGEGPARFRAAFAGYMLDAFDLIVLTLSLAAIGTTFGVGTGATGALSTVTLSARRSAGSSAACSPTGSAARGR